MKTGRCFRGASAALFFFLLLSCSGQTSEKQLSDYLAKADTHIQSGSLFEAEQDVLKAVEIARTRADWLSVLKRAYRTGEAAGSHELLFRTADKALDKISGAEEIAALYVFAGLRTGRVELAYKKANELLDSDAWQAIKNEAVLRKHALDGIPIGEEEDLIMAAAVTRDPVVLQQAASVFSEPEFALDAALLLAERGEMYQASLTLGDPTEGLKVPAFFIAYDSERFVHARAIGMSLTEGGLLEDLNIIMADILLRLEMYLEAEKAYLDILERVPDYSWVPYVNLAYLLMESGLYSEALGMTASGLGIFPDSWVLKVAQIEVLQSAGEMETAAALLRTYREMYPDNQDLAVLSYRISPTNANRLRLSSLLWEVFLREPEDKKSASYLAGYLIAGGDTTGLTSMIAAWERENGKTEWSCFMRATYSLLENDTDTAFLEYENAWKLYPRWETAFNLAVISRYQLDYSGALEYLRMAESALKRDSAGGVSDKAVIRVQMAENLYAQGHFEAARREAQYALDLDLGANGASLLLKMLESRAD